VQDLCTATNRGKAAAKKDALLPDRSVPLKTAKAALLQAVDITVGILTKAVFIKEDKLYGMQELP
jgi:hypothetical protein